MAYDNNNRGSVWKNDDKASDKHPDFKGSLIVDGKEYWVSAGRRKEGANPKAPALSFAVKLKEQINRNPEPPKDFKEAAPFDDDLPF